MVTVVDLPEIIPVFPLPGALLLPRARLPLHIFEPRYLQMVEDSLKTTGRLIGMIQPSATPTGRDALHSIGCVGRITQFSETEDHRYLITLSGVSRFRVCKEVDGFTPYRRCEVSWTGFERDRGAAECDDGFDRTAFMDLLNRCFVAKKLDTNWETLEEADDELLINSLSMFLDFEAEDKQALLEAPSLRTRRETLVTLMEFSLRGGTGEEFLQ
ncbi:MAG: LON peptidase substrate-binding domain-containing protein [Paracoccaceae bacterium]|nr:LON peptidase substrate-binding domain-containing protein [Marinibacterium sp.]